MKEQRLVSLDSSVNIVSDRLKTVNAALSAARLDRLQLEELNNQIVSFQKDGRNLLEIAAIANHGTVPAVSAQLSELTRQQSVLAQRYFERHPKMIELEKSIKAAREQLARATELAVADLSREPRKTRANERSLEQEYALNERSRPPPRSLDRLQEPENQAAVAKANYTQILDRLSQATTSSNLERICVRPLVPDPATQYGSTLTPKHSLHHQDLRRPFCTRLCRRRHRPQFHRRPHQELVGRRTLHRRQPPRHRPRSFRAQRRRQILARFEEPRSPRRRVVPQRLQFGENPLEARFPQIDHWSPPRSPGEGKILVSSDLAGSFARHGKRTLLIDCGLRRPMVHRHFNQPNDNGLITWFEHGANLDGDLTENHT
ncbi:MAG: hypothetical protein QM760_08910 [Nibricoccus sp.]